MPLNHPETTPTLPSMEKLSSMKLALGARKVGDPGLVGSGGLQSPFFQTLSSEDDLISQLGNHYLA